MKIKSLVEIDKTRANAFRVVTLQNGERVMTKEMSEAEMLLMLGGMIARTLFDGLKIGETAHVELSKSPTLPF